MLRYVVLLTVAAVIITPVVFAALGGFRDPALVRRALDYSLTPALNSTEFLSILLGSRGRSGASGRPRPRLAGGRRPPGRG